SSRAARTCSTTITRTFSAIAAKGGAFMPASALLLAASAGIRAASRNLCTDEYLWRLAEPRQIVGVSYLARDRRETALWRQAQRYPGNRGSIEDVLPLRPNLL